MSQTQEENLTDVLIAEYAKISLLFRDVITKIDADEAVETDGVLNVLDASGAKVNKSILVDKMNSDEQE